MTFLAITDSEMFEKGLFTVQPEAEHSVHLPTKRLFGIVPGTLLPLLLLKRPLPFPVPLRTRSLLFPVDETVLEVICGDGDGGSNSVPSAT